MSILPDDAHFDELPSLHDTAAAQARLDALDAPQMAKLDHAILSHAGREYRKCAMIVGRMLVEPAWSDMDEEDIRLRIEALRDSGALFGVGDPRLMRRSEVRLPGSEPLSEAISPTELARILAKHKIA